MRLAKVIIFVLVVTLVFTGLIGFFGFRVVERRIARDSHAPHLVRFPEPAADFPMQTLDGTTKRLSEMKGKVVFLDLWGTWCIQCLAEMPTVQALYNHYRNDPKVVFLIVSRQDSPGAIRRYASRNRFDLPFYRTEDVDVPASMQLNQFPATFLYAPDGTLMAKHTGAADWSAPSVISFIDSLKSSSRAEQ